MKTIIIREFLEHIKSLQFYILVLVSTILFSISGWVATNDYQEQVAGYNENMASLKAGPSTMITSCYRKPNPLLFLASGNSKTLSNGVMLSPKGNIREGETGELNYRMPIVPELDWTFIIKIVFSLYVILLSFNAISGEKESGTLRIIAANPVQRGKIVLGKYLSIVLTLLIPLTLGGILCLLIESFYIPDVLTFGSLMRVLLMLFLALVYLSLFIFLGIFVSSLIHRSSLSLLVLLAVWIFFGFIVPNISGILAEKLAAIPSEFETSQQMGPMMQQEVWARIASITERAEQGEFETKEQILEETDQAFEEAQEKVRQYYTNFDNAMLQRTVTARTIARLSPSALFQYAAEGIAASGHLRQQHFIDDVRAFSTVYDAYVLSKLGKLVGSSNWSFGTGMTFKGEYVDISSPSPEEYTGDKSDFPFFEESDPKILENLRGVMFDISGLLLWTVIFAMLAFAAIARCDVR